MDNDISMFKWENNPRTKLERTSQGQIISKNFKNPTTFVLHEKKVIYTGYSNGSVLVTDAETLEDLYCLVGHSSEITGIGLFTKTVLVTCSKDGLLSTWDLDKRIRLKSAKAHDRALTSLSVRYPSIVTTGWDGVIKTWDKMLTNISSVSPNIGPLNCVLVHPRKDLCITGGWDKTIRIWSLQELKYPKAIIRGHTSSVQSIKLTEDCRKLISGSLDGVVKIWDSSAGYEVASFETGYGLSHLDLDDMSQTIHLEISRRQCCLKV